MKLPNVYRYSPVRTACNSLFLHYLYQYNERKSNYFQDDDFIERWILKRQKMNFHLFYYSLVSWFRFRIIYHPVKYFALMRHASDVKVRAQIFSISMIHAIASQIRVIIHHYDTICHLYTSKCCVVPMVFSMYVQQSNRTDIKPPDVKE